MKKVFLSIYILLVTLICIWTAKCVLELKTEKTLEEESFAVILATEALPAEEDISAEVPAQAPAEVPAGTETAEPAETIAEVPTEAPMEAPAEYVYAFTPEEEELLLKIGMAERGDTGCKECIALVMRTVLNRVEGPKFSNTIRRVLYAENQFTPVVEGTFESAQPNDACHEALQMIKTGWDESQGALYYEWCEGESWHSRSLNLLLQHCDTRFYN